MLALVTAATVLSQSWGPPGQSNGQFKPGWNGLARTPPMGWRSWNAFGNRITQDMMMGAAEAIVAKNRTVAGRKGMVSLCDLGYCSVGVDEGWEGCGQGVNHTQHDANGIPTIDSAFPDTGAMVKKIHGLGLAAGWYLNGCKCGEHVEKKINYEGDIKSLHQFDFDGVKIDGCGHQRNQTLYAQLMAQSGKNYTIENCHWGDCTESDDSSCPTQEWCPFNWYRSSGDINSGSESWLDNLQTTIKFQDYEKPLSQPGCWAYPDMLEVGRVVEPSPGTFLSWNRAHFGAWCVVSAPLILGLELTDAKLAPILDIIGNAEAIRVNQQWSGHPGMLVENVMLPPVPYSPNGAVVPSTSAGDMDCKGAASIGGGRPDAATSGAANIRTGNPGDVSLIRIGTGLIGNGHSLATVSMSFRYVAGYTPGPTQKARAPTIRVLLLNMATGKELKTLLTTGPLGNYSYDHFTGYSPAVEVHATGLSVPDDSAVIIAIEVTNNQRNLQIPIDDKAAGFNIHVTWGAAASGSSGTLTHGARQPIMSGFFGSGQLWAKRQPGGASAALLINHSDRTLKYTLKMASLNLTATKYDVRNIWAQKDVGSAEKTFLLTVPPYDSAFLLLTPAGAE